MDAHIDNVEMFSGPSTIRRGPGVGPAVGGSGSQLRTGPRADGPTSEELDTALRRSEFRLVYQPQVDVARRAVRAVEALLRWEHPRFGLLAPAEFIPLAERTGHADALLRWGVREALLQSIVWAQDGARFPVAVNVSPAATAAYLGRLLSLRGSDARQVILEFRDAHLRNDPTLRAELAVLRQDGLRTCLDGLDLRLELPLDWPIDEVKLPSELIRNIAAEPAARAAVRAQIAALRDRGLTVIALGVETAADVADAEDLAVDALQGFAVSAPLSSGGLAAWLDGPTGSPRDGRDSAPASA